MSMTPQQIHIAETIRGMKVALRRQRAASPAPSQDSSEDEDGALHTYTNRGNKLRQGSQFVQQGRLDWTGGQQAYKRKVNHAGYERYIIKKKPKLYDEDGELVDPADIPSDADEQDIAAYAQPRAVDPFSEVKLEHVLRPLTSAAELPDHPGYSHAFTSKTLTWMVKEAEEMVRREKASLWKAKRLLERFRGDGGFMSCDRFQTENDEALLDDGEAKEQVGGGLSVVPSIIGTDRAETVAAPGPPKDVQQADDGTASTEKVTDGVEAQDHVPIPDTNGGPTHTHAEADGEVGHPEGVETAAPDITAASNGRRSALGVKDSGFSNNDDDSSNANTNPSAPSHSMTTRARARSPQLPVSPSPSPSDSASIPTVHPWFQIPPTAIPDRDLGLPPIEAEETRKLLLLYVQKQENIVRQLTTLYEGLARADRTRRDVFRACKAEAHIVPDGKGGVKTDMSDGEDWYDLADWDLQPGFDNRLKGDTLEKGKDEVEDGAEEEGRRVGGRRRRVVGVGR